MPAGGALFGGSASGPGSTGGNKHLIETRAGKMNLKGRTVFPDKRKGLLYVYQSDDSLMHFCWQDRSTGVVEDDLIIFPDDCEYVKVPQCTTGRVYLLKFKSSNRKFFFWLQEPKADKDDDNCKRINELLNNPSCAMQSGQQNQDQDLQSLLNNMSQSQLIQLFGSGVGQMGGLSSLLGTIRGPNNGGSARTSSSSSSASPSVAHRASAVPTTPTPAPASANASSSSPGAGMVTPQSSAAAPVVVPDAPRASRHSAGSGGRDAHPLSVVQLSDLKNLLQALSPAGGAAAASGSGSGQSVDLSTALNSDALSGVLNSPEALQQLQSHLPAVDGNSQEALRSTLASPQFQQAVSQFSSALESGQLGPVVSQLAVNPDAVQAASEGNMQDFVKALEKSTADAAAAEKEKEDKKKKDDDEQMQLD